LDKLKWEIPDLKAYQNGSEARAGIGAYLDFYNWERPHQALGYRTPEEVFKEGMRNRCLQEQEGVLPSGIDTLKSATGA
jgi:hypothetical protein